MAMVLNKEEILDLVQGIDVVAEIEKAFIAYSQGKCVVPPVGELLFPEENGETHIKYGYVKGGTHYVIKVASGFYDNPKQGIPSSQGMILVFNQKTGQSEAVLMDEGHLTNIRTAAAGALSVKYFAPQKVKAIGIIGCGIQGELQLKYLQEFRSCKQVYVWDINKENALAFQKRLQPEFNIEIVDRPQDLAKQVNLIISCTPSQEVLLKTEHIQPGTHITAVGSDTPEKQELEAGILAKADLVISDSIDQSKSRGEVYRARLENCIAEEKLFELGNAIQNKELQRSNEDQITVVDLTGVAVQDIMIAQAVLRAKSI